MHKRAELLSALRAALGDVPGVAVIHSSFAALAPSGGLSRWDAVWPFGVLAREGWTFAFPAFTFSFCRSGVFDPQDSASETGVLADWILDSIDGARRSAHPIYSFALIGPRAGEIAGFPSETTFGDSSPFGFFETQNARVVMLGADWSFCTPFHRYEEKAEVPYRLFKTFEGQAGPADAAQPVAASMYVRDLEIGAVNDFTPLVAHLRAAGGIQTVPLWRGQIEAASMQDIRASAEAVLSEDPLGFVSNAAAVRHRLEQRAEAARQAPFRIALLGASNLDIAAGQLGDRLRELLPERHCQIHVPPFGQVEQQIYQPGSDLAEFSAELTIFADRLEDLLGIPALDLADPDTALDAARDHARKIAHYVAGNGGTALVHRFAVTGRSSIEQGNTLAALVASCNAILDEALGEDPGVVFLDLAAELAQGIPAQDMRLWHLGRLPFSAGFTERLAERWAGVALAMLGKTARLLVLDLDNTLWGGVLGEDGIEGIAIGGDFPGNAFARFQRSLKALSDRGIALAVSSKNDEDLALEALGNHAQMILRPDDLVAHRISWQPKFQSIREIAAELDLGLASVMFVDDNPVEREAVRLNLPMVKLLDLPEDPTAYTDALLRSPYLETLRSSAEDRKRVASYKTRKKINLERGKAASMEDFLRGLNMQLHLQPLDSSNLARAAQLCQKTNQFNTTTRRHAPRDLEQMAEAGADVAVIGLQDKFSERENIGLIILTEDEGKTGEVDLFLLSCRVLGRTVERAALDWAVSRAHHRGWTTLVGEVIETPRNSPARQVFADNGFTPGARPGLWETTPRDEDYPDWFTVHDGFADK